MAWLFARSSGGRFRLRVEDLDPDRSEVRWEAVQLAALAELGLDWDGPVVRQSERRADYASALAQLEALGRVYPCFCTRAEIRAAASAPHGERPAGAYPGTCRGLGRAEAAARVARGERQALRFDAQGERVEFLDQLAGPRSGVVDDFVLRRSDGVSAYQLAVVVDDRHQGVTQVVRGADLLDSVGRQVLVMRALGYPEPDWAHVPLVIGPDGSRLAKRHAFSAAPATPAETLGVLAASLGIRVPAPLSSARELLNRFDPGSIPREPFTPS